MPKVNVTLDEDVYNELGKHVRGFETPNDGLRRMLFGEQGPPKGGFTFPTAWGFDEADQRRSDQPWGQARPPSEAQRRDARGHRRGRRLVDDEARVSTHPHPPLWAILLAPPSAARSSGFMNRPARQSTS